MRRILATCTVLLAVWPGVAAGQARSPARRPASSTNDRLGLSCARILSMNPAEWVAYFQKNGPSPAAGGAGGIGRATAAYGRCYDARTDRLAVALARARKGPPLAARRNFSDFESALRDFTEKVAATDDEPSRAEKFAYAALYEKQFRYAFYQSYAAPAKKAAAPPSAPPSAPKPPTQNAAPASGPSEPQAQENVDPLTAAKNHFGALLGAFPDDQMHELHAAFGKVLQRRPPGIATELAVYRYANFLLAPASEALPPAPLFQAARAVFDLPPRRVQLFG